jgi:hypothetical protein
MFKEFRIHLIALAIFLGVTAIFNAPAFSGKVIEQNDIKQYQGSASEVHKYRNEEGRQILWTNVMFAGMPTYVISAVYGGELLKYIPKAFTKTLSPAVGYPLLLMIGFYILALAFKFDPRIGVAGALAYGLSTYFIIVLEAGHNSKIHAMAYLPGILAGMVYAYRQKKILSGAAIFALFTGLELTARHPQMFYYFLFLAIPYGIWELVQAQREKQMPSYLKATGLLLVAGLLAVAANLPYLSNTYQYGKHSIRGKSELTSNQENKTEGLNRDYVTDWSYGISESFSLIIPNFKGGPTGRIADNEKAMEEIDPRFKQAVAGQNAYFGDQPFTSGPVYAGAVVVLLAFLAFFFAKGTFRYVLLGVFLLTLALAWGRNFEGLTNFFLDNVPFYNKFRAVSSFMVIPELILPILAILSLAGIAKYNAADWKSDMKLWIGGSFKRGLVLQAAAGIVALFLAINLLSPGLFNDFLSSKEATELPNILKDAGFNQNQANDFITALEEARIAIFKSDVMRSFLFVLLGGLILFLYQRGVLARNYFIIGFTILIVIDLFPVNKRYLNSSNFVDADKLENNYGVQPSPADRAIMSQYAKDPYFRTLNLTVSTFNDASTSFFHYSLGGYHGAKLKIYQELAETELNNNIQQLQANFSRGLMGSQAFAGLNAINMLNTRYVIASGQKGPIPVENPQRLGNAWLVNNVQSVATADEELAAVSTFDPSRTAIMRSNYAEQVGDLKPSNGTISLKSYDPEELVYDYQSDGSSLAVFSEIWYPENWIAEIDGEEVSLLRANYLLRAIKVPAGKHTITMRYVDTASGTANTLALISSLIIIIAVPVLLIRDNKKVAA